MLPPFFDEFELADLQEQDEAAMPSTVTVTTITSGTDAGGAPTESESTITTVGRLRKRSGREVSGDALQERGAYELALPRETVISGTSRVSVNGVPFRVVWAPVLVEYDTARVVGVEEA
jgi:hypothetical protein